MSKAQKTKNQKKTNEPKEKVFWKHLLLAYWAGQYDPEIEIDSFLPLEWSEEMTHMEETELLLEGKSQRKGLSSAEKNAINSMMLRSRFVERLIGGGILVINADTEMEMEEVKAYLNSLSPDELEETVKEANLPWPKTLGNL